MTIYQALQSAGLPVAYSHFRRGEQPPFLVYVGNGQATMAADNTFYWAKNLYRIEYYYKEKNEETEARIEAALLAAGYLYDKSDDVYIDDEDMYVIYYTV